MSKLWRIRHKCFAFRFSDELAGLDTGVMIVDYENGVL